MERFLIIITYIYINCRRHKNLISRFGIFTHPGTPIVSKMHLSWIIVSCLFLVTNFTGYAFSQTTIVVIRTPEEILIGADSKITDIWKRPITKSACKIKQADGLFFTFAGLPKFTRSGYDLYAIVNKACQSGDNLFDKVKTFDKLIVAPLSNALKRIKSRRPTYFNKEIEGKAVLQIVFAGVERQVPLFFMRSIEVEGHNRDSPSIIIRKVSCPGDCSRGEMIVYLGYHNAITSFLAGSGNFWEIGYVAGIRKLITIQIEANPDNVGPPIDILRIDKSGAKWVQKKPGCPEIRE